jgi:phospholipid/cholesterol/gamma-HCH transport system ATP-binding protein
VIEYRDVWKAFDAPVLAGVTLTVQTGEILAVVGPSGTGKSVLLKTTIGLIQPDRGDVLVDGVSVTQSDHRRLQDIRRKAGYVFQYAALFDSMTVFENVSYGISDAMAKQIGRQEVLRRVVEALEDVNLSPRQVMGKLPAELSGGMRKRVGLARAIVGHPEILLYDEPVTGLDPVNTAAVDQLIAEIATRKKVTSVVVTHDIEGALRFSQRVALLEGGLLRFLGTPAEFRTSTEPLVRAFYDRDAAAAAARDLTGSNGGYR